MSVVWKVNGTTFAAAGLSGLRRELRSLAADQVTFLANGSAVDSAEISGLSLGDTVTITVEVDAVATQWFHGVVTELPREGTDGGEALRYVVTGPWWHLDNLVYQQKFPLDAVTNPEYADPGNARRAVAMIGQAPNGQHETNSTTLTDILDWCIAAGAPFARGTLPAGFNIPFISLIAPICSEAVRACCKWMPDAATRFDYSAATPVFSAVRRGDATPVGIDLTGDGAIKQLSITPRPDLKIDHVVIQKIALSNSYYFEVTLDVDPVGSTGLEFGSVVVPLDSNDESLPAGLAANWRSSLSTLQYQGKIVFEDSECLRGILPGDVLNISNGLAAWATMRAQVMEVNEDVDTGTTEIVFGPPEHLAVQDLIELLKVARQQRTAYDGPPLVAGRRNDPEEGPEESPATVLDAVVEAAEAWASNAETQAGFAETSATNAATSETNAATSAGNAATSESNAAASETAAEGWATAANAAADEADAWAVAAAASADVAEAAADLADASALAAGVSETNAATSESNAATSELNASGYEANAAISEGACAASELAAATSESNAAASETVAEGWATAANAAAAEADAWAVDASASADVAEAAADLAASEVAAAITAADIPGQVATAIAALPTQIIDVCGLGSVTFYTTA